MLHYRSLAEVALREGWLTIGVFDGLHRGHQAILRRLVAGAQARGVPAVLLTFDPHPAQVLTGQAIPLLTTPDERANLAASLGVEVVITHPFDRQLAQMSARVFMALLVRHLGLRHLVVGYDFALGRGREGNVSRLIELGSELGYTVEVVDVVADAHGVISSTEIRNRIAAGDVETAALLLGHPYTLSGTVVHGDGRGRRIHLPTANLAYPPNKLIPANGIYACRARLGRDLYAAATNIGINPTFTPSRQSVSVETYLLDFNRTIYGETLTLEFVTRLREERKYESVEALLAQIHLDIEQTRRLVSLEG